MSKKPCRPLTVDEIKLMMAHGFTGKYWKRNLCIFTLALLSGYRISEVLSLKIADVCKISKTDEMGLDIDVYNKIVVASSNMKGKKSSRSVPLSALMKETIYQWVLDFQSVFGYEPTSNRELIPVKLTQKELDEIERKNKVIEVQNQALTLLGKKPKKLLTIPETKMLECGMYLFPSNKGVQNPTLLKNGAINFQDKYSHIGLRQADRIYQEAFKNAGFKNEGSGVLSTHSCRKSFAQEMQSFHKDDLMSIQKAMGHALISTTMKYLAYQDPKVESGIVNAFPYLVDKEVQKKIEKRELMLEIEDLDFV